MSHFFELVIADMPALSAGRICDSMKPLANESEPSSVYLLLRLLVTSRLSIHPWRDLLHRRAHSITTPTLPRWALAHPLTILLPYPSTVVPLPPLTPHIRIIAIHLTMPPRPCRRPRLLTSATVLRPAVHSPAHSTQHLPTSTVLPFLPSLPSAKTASEVPLPLSPNIVSTPFPLLLPSQTKPIETKAPTGAKHLPIQILQRTKDHAADLLHQNTNVLPSLSV